MRSDVDLFFDTVYVTTHKDKDTMPAIEAGMYAIRVKRGNSGYGYNY